MNLKIDELGLDKNINEAFEQSFARVVEHQDLITRLFKELRAFRGALDKESQKESDLNFSKVQSLVRRAESFLRLCQKDPRAECVPYCLAAVDYLVSFEDAEFDLASYEGFDDDEKVFDAINDRFSLSI